MKTKNIVTISLLTLVFVLSGCVSVALTGDRFVSNKNVKFGNDSAQLSESFFAFISPSGQILGQVADILKAHPDIRRVRIEGHSDAVGDAAHNQTLSAARAASCATWLRAHGVTTQLDTAGFGSTRPLCRENTSSCNARNRRVEFVVVERAGAPAAAVAAAATP